MSDPAKAVDLGIYQECDKVSIVRIVESYLDPIGGDADEPRGKLRGQARDRFARLTLAEIMGRFGFGIEPITSSLWHAYRIVIQRDGEVVTNPEGQPYTATCGGTARMGEAIESVMNQIHQDADSLIDDALTDTSDAEMRRTHPREL